LGATEEEEEEEEEEDGLFEVERFSKYATVSAQNRAE
jgi:hypothetical protein